MVHDVRIQTGKDYLYCDVNDCMGDYSLEYSSAEEWLNAYTLDIVNCCKNNGYTESETEKVLSHYEIKAKCYNWRTD